MPPTAVESCFEIAFWFLDRALTDGEYLQPQKMQRLMFLAQAYFGVVQNGLKLMPATFVAGEEGPLEPTIYRAFARGRPMVDLKPVDETAQHVLDSVWRQFGSYSMEKLNDLVKRHPPYADAFAMAPASEIDFEAMVAFYGEKPGARRSASSASPSTPSASKVMRPKLMRNATGKPVSVNRWTPKRVD
ncbi:MAG: hypothetical protein EPO08_14085 [Rhodospirillaceae bacterium]|nr:MAG: hypothetical protein EPO08_14085 [Rhodospirillaceae bacterium]